MNDFSQSPGSMSDRQFNAAAEHAGLSLQQRARARRVLVDGETVLNVAASEEVSALVVYEAIRKVCPI